MKTILVILLMSVSITVFAGDKNWKTEYRNGTYYIVDGPLGSGSTNWIEAGSERKAKKLAKKLNKIKKKDSKGVRDDGTGNCDNPLINC